MKKLKILLATIIILLSIFLCQQIIVAARTNQVNKIDAAELGNIRYGLLSIDAWKEQISNIVLVEIEKLDVAKTHEKELKKTVEDQLNILIDKINAQIRQSNKKSSTGWVKQAFMDLFVSVDTIKKGVPKYADAMIKEMKKPKTQVTMKKILKEKVTYYIDQTFDMQDMSQINRILYKTNAVDVEDAKVKLSNEISEKYNRIVKMAIILICLSVLLFLLPAFDKGPLEPYIYVTLVISLLMLLATGVTTPMIDMEAKISQMTFVLLDHKINFANQVLFFQSKSVLDVFWIMITHESVQMKFVGILMVLFSIVFPVLKLTSSAIYYYDCRNLRKSKWIQFFVLHSGKWSMADVLVVAIFMAYIGFNGIISSQFGKLSNASKDIVILTTNGTSLQPGYYIFLTYAILALFLSVFLTRKPHVKCE